MHCRHCTRLIASLNVHVRRRLSKISLQSAVNTARFRSSLAATTPDFTSRSALHLAAEFLLISFWLFVAGRSTHFARMRLTMARQTDLSERCFRGGSGTGNPIEAICFRVACSLYCQLNPDVKVSTHFKLIPPTRSKRYFFCRERPFLKVDSRENLAFRYRICTASSCV